MSDDRAALAAEWRAIADEWAAIRAERLALDTERNGQSPDVRTNRPPVTSGQEPSTTRETVAQPSDVSDDAPGSHVTRHVATLLTASETARRLSVSPSTLYRLRRRGELPGTRVGRSVRYAEGDVAAYLEQHRD